MLGFSFSLLRCEGSENQALTDRTPCKMNTTPAKNFFPRMSLCPAFRSRLRSLWHQFFGTIALMEFVLKSPCQQLCSFILVSLPANGAMPVPWTRVWKLWQILGAQFFETIVLMKFVLKNPCQQLRIFRVAPCIFANEAMHVPSPSVRTPLDKSWAHSFSAQWHWWNLPWKTRANSFALLF